MKAKQREYAKEHNQKPEVNAKKTEYRKEYYEKPEVKARKREYERARYQANKANLQEVAQPKLTSPVDP
ncbi:MAG: hypothetical protein FRX49_02960 [Trebouxia sp. A1-2]|nr:MAG: hypothetical protein FRX49_02960 [Trebouxia sp. A1-2]